MKRLILPALAALSLTACATAPTLYQPAAGPRAGVGSLAAGEPGAGVQKRPDGVESVGGDESAGDAIPQAFLHLRGEGIGRGLEVGVEQGAPPAQRVEHFTSRAGGGFGRRHGPAMGLQEPGQILQATEVAAKPRSRDDYRSAAPR